MQQHNIHGSFSFTPHATFVSALPGENTTSEILIMTESC